MKRIAFLAAICSGLMLPATALAQKVTDLGVAPFGSVIAQLYSKSLQVVGLAVFVMFLIAGLGYIIPQRFKPAFMNNPTQIMMDAVIGTILLFSAYVILNTINPSLTVLQGGVAPTTTTTGSGDILPTAGSAECAALQQSFSDAYTRCQAGHPESCTITDSIVIHAEELKCTLTPPGQEAPTPAPAATPTPACSNFEIIPGVTLQAQYDQAKADCAKGDATACEDRDTAAQAAQGLCTLTP